MLQARPSCSVAFSNGSTKLAQLTCAIGASSSVTSLLALASRVSTAGVTCPGLIASKRARPEKSSKGLLSAVIVVSVVVVIGTQVLSAASIVLTSNMVMVIGPTPPGTGVM